MMFSKHTQSATTFFQTIDAEMQAVGCGLLDVLVDLTEVGSWPDRHRLLQTSMMNNESMKLVVSLTALASWRL
jgi:hypothetical protein